MKIEINKNGCLCIERNGIMKQVMCPYNNDGYKCGDWCALFGELEPNNHLLNICGNNAIVYSQCIDNREKQNA